MQKKYIIDTNIFIDDPNCIEVLRNGEENHIFIPEIVINEIDGLKRKTHIRQQLREVINNLDKHKDQINIFGKILKDKSPDDNIIQNIKSDNVLFNDGILVSNDKLLRFKAHKQGIKTQEYTSSKPFKSESEIYTGFIKQHEDDLINNCFYWDKGKLYFYRNQIQTMINYDCNIWNLKPLTKYQNAYMMLLDNNDIKLVSVQSYPGLGKTILSLAAGLKSVFQTKNYKKIIVIKPNIEIGQELGFLPGSVDEKMNPYFNPIKKFLYKLHNQRHCNKLFNENGNFDEFKIEMIPINYLRGVDIEDAFVIIDEVQNITRLELRTVLSRMGNNVKCVCTGDVNQIDNKYCNKNNNGMNWMVKKFLNDSIYAHITLKGKHSRGPIADLVRNNKL